MATTKKTLWITSTLGGLGKSSLAAALTHLVDHDVLPPTTLLDLDTDPRVGHRWKLEHEQSWESDKARLAALVEALFTGATSRLLVNFPAASHEMVRNVPETLYVKGSLAQHGWEVGLVHILEPNAGDISYSMLTDANPLFALAQHHWVLLPEHRGVVKGKDLNIPNVDAILTLPAWGELLETPHFSEILERRTDDALPFEQGIVLMWVMQLVSALEPIITWFGADEPDRSESGDESDTEAHVGASGVDSDQA